MPGILIFAGLHGFLAVALGALAAHAASGYFDEKALGWLDTGAHYGLAHALVLLAMGLDPNHGRGRFHDTIAWLFALGISFFSGGLYVMALSGRSSLAGLVPFGGMLLILAWFLVAAYGILRWRSSRAS